MITRDEAISIVADYWNKDISQEGDEFHPCSVELTEVGDYWLLHGNTKASVVGGIEIRTAVGVTGFIVDAKSGNLVVVGSAQDVSDILEDCRDDSVLSGQTYVLAVGLGAADIAEIKALRKLFPCSYGRARELLRVPERYWFQGKLRNLKCYQQELADAGMISEIIVLDEASNAIEIDWRSAFSWDLFKISERI